MDEPFALCLIHLTPGEAAQRRLTATSWLHHREPPTTGHAPQMYESLARWLDSTIDAATAVAVAHRIALAATRCSHASEPDHEFFLNLLGILDGLDLEVLGREMV